MASEILESPLPYLMCPLFYSLKKWSLVRELEKALLFGNDSIVL